MAYTRHHNDQTCLVVLNLGTSTVNTTVAGLEAGTWKLAIDVENINAGLTATPVTFNSTQSFSVPAGGYKVYYKGEPASHYAAGDVNRDGEVNIADVTTLIDFILSRGPGDVAPDYYDINHDNEVNVSDVNALISIILYN